MRWMTSQLEGLLTKLVQAENRVAYARRQPFQMDESGEQAATATINHPGLPGGHLLAQPRDVDQLGHEGFVSFAKRLQGEGGLFDLTPDAREYYEEYIAPADDDDEE